MNLDNADFKKRVEEAKAEEGKIDAFRLEVIKWHALIDKDLDSFISAALPNPSYVKLEDMNFYRKGNLALALSLKDDKDPMWAVFWAITHLRNKSAHVFEPRIVKEKMDYLRKTYIGILGSNQKADAEKKTDPDIVKEATWLVMGFLGQLTQDAKGRAAIIDEHWEGRS
jgi:hypothetical protein